MTGTLLISFRGSNGSVHTVSKKKYEVYDDEWDMLSELQRHYGCLPWKLEADWTFVADICVKDGVCEYFTAQFITKQND